MNKVTFLSALTVFVCSFAAPVSATHGTTGGFSTAAAPNPPTSQPAKPSTVPAQAGTCDPKTVDCIKEFLASLPKPKDAEVRCREGTTGEITDGKCVCDGNGLTMVVGNIPRTQHTRFIVKKCVPTKGLVDDLLTQIKQLEQDKASADDVYTKKEIDTVIELLSLQLGNVQSGVLVNKAMIDLAMRRLNELEPRVDKLERQAKLNKVEVLAGLGGELASRGGVGGPAMSGNVTGGVAGNFSSLWGVTFLLRAGLFGSNTTGTGGQAGGEIGPHYNFNDDHRISINLAFNQQVQTDGRSTGFYVGPRLRTSHCFAGSFCLSPSFGLAVGNQTGRKPNGPEQGEPWHETGVVQWNGGLDAIFRTGLFD